MPIPALDKDGFLPIGVHDCSLDEIKGRFGSFQTSERRPQLFAKLVAFLNDARISNIVRRVLVNGSFTTSKSEPNDIDIIVIVPASLSFSTDFSALEYNVLSRHRVRRRFGFDILVARENSIELQRWTAFFQQVRLAPGRGKGILQVRI